MCNYPDKYEKQVEAKSYSCVHTHAHVNTQIADLKAYVYCETTYELN